MNILVEILHPAHVHFFKHAIGEWRRRGDSVLVLSREKECASDLLRAYEIPHTAISRLHRGKPALLLEMLIRSWRMWKACRSFNPDILTGIMGVTIAPVGKVIRRPAVVFYDTENATLTNRIVYPLAHSVCTPACYTAAVHGRHVTYPGYHELAYLHPNRFTPDPSVVRRSGIDPKEAFFLVRFVSWQASHDIGEQGLTLNMQKDIIGRLQKRGRVLVSSEAALPPDLQPYSFPAQPHEMHHYLAFAKMVVGESATMASEAAVLGVPAVFISDTGRGYTDEEEWEYGLVHHFNRHQGKDIMRTIDNLLADNKLKEKCAERRQRLLKDKIDVTEWIVDYIDSVVSSLK